MCVWPAGLTYYNIVSDQLTLNSHFEVFTERGQVGVGGPQGPRPQLLLDAHYTEHDDEIQDNNAAAPDHICDGLVLYLLSSHSSAYH